MLKNYFKIAIRNLGRHKTYSVINVTGLAVGLACCLLILFYVRHEHSYDQFHENSDHIYRIARIGNFGGGQQSFAMTSLLLAPTLENSFPDVENTVRLYPDDGVVRVGEQRFQEDVLFVDASFFEVFTFPLQQGDPAQALAGPDGVVLSHEAAYKFFGEADPLGQRLTIRLHETFFDFTVRGVAAPIPAASSIRFEVLLSIEKLADIDHRQFVNPSWRSLRPRTYVQLAASVQGADFEAKLPAFVEDHLPSGSAEQVQYQVQPLTAIHLDPSVTMGLAPTSNPVYSYILSVVALFILLIACINFTTLTLGRSASRVREVGVRKVVGAVRTQLMRQFWGEAFAISLIALMLALVLVEMLLPAFSNLVGEDLRFHVDGVLLLALVGLLVVVSLLAGSYPAVFLSRFHPVAVLKGHFTGSGKNRLTQALVVAQFTLSIFLVTCMLLMSEQLGLLFEKNLGFNQEQVVRIRAEYGRTWEGKRLLESYRVALADEPSVLGLTGSMYELGRPDEASNYFPLTSEADSVRGYVINVTPEFVETLGLALVQGRNFSLDRGADTLKAVLVNETLVKAFGWEDPIGQPLNSFEFSGAAVVGVIKDFHYESLHKPIEPMALYIGQRMPIWAIYARVAPGDLAASLATLERAWTAMSPDLPFEFTFLDQEVERLYRSEQRWTTLIRLASAFAIFIACLGLLGLAALAAIKRRKEIGIRKAFGASTEQIVMLLTKRFVLLVALALGLAAPMAYLAMQRWLQDFAYRIDLSWQTFLMAGLAVLVIALATVAYQAIKAALTDPAESLRYE